MYSESDALSMLGPLMIVLLAFAVFAIIVMWKIFEKANQPGWAVLIPFYNLYVYTQIVKRPGWWMLLYFLGAVPVIGSIAVLVISILDNIRLSRAFGKSDGFAVGLIFLSIIFLAILAFGDATYDNSDADMNSDILDA